MTILLRCGFLLDDQEPSIIAAPSADNVWLVM